MSRDRGSGGVALLRPARAARRPGGPCGSSPSALPLCQFSCTDSGSASEDAQGRRTLGISLSRVRSRVHRVPCDDRCARAYPSTKKPSSAVRHKGRNDLTGKHQDKKGEPGCGSPWSLGRCRSPIHRGLKTMAKPDDLPRYRSNLQGEIDGAAVYAALAESEADPKLAEVFRRLAAVEQAHGDFWRKRIEAEGARFATAPSGRARVMAWLARRFGPSFVLPTLADHEARDSASYYNQPEARDAGLPSDERSHALVMRTIAGGGGLAGPTVAMLEGRHRGGGNTLRAAGLGAHDGR